MDYLVNDRSLHGQFSSKSFHQALGIVMQMRKVIRDFGTDVYCHRSLLDLAVGSDLSFQSAVGGLPREQRSAVLAWLSRGGPFWDDERLHGPGEWLEWRGEVVTDTAIGEAAYANLHGIARHLISFAPSDLAENPLDVDWVRDDGAGRSIGVPNFWNPIVLRQALEGSSESAIASWADIKAVACRRFDALTIVDHAFEALSGHPFVRGAAERIMVLLSILNRLKLCFDETGSRTTEGHSIYQDFFTGKKGEGGRGAWFSDSSDSEKSDYKKEMTFRCPNADGVEDKLFCPWHGKVQTPQLRLHFSFPIRRDSPLYVVYVGPKITK